MKRDLTISVLETFVLTITLFAVIPIAGQSDFDYDPWADTNDDGKIDMKDIGYSARLFGTSGTPINKTEELIQLRIDLNTLNDSVTTINDSLLTVDATLNARLPVRGYISVPTGAFVRMYYYDENFIWETTIIDTTDWGYFVGSVYLPHGSTIKAMTIYYYDVGQYDIELILYRYNQTLASFQTLVRVTSQGEVGYGSSYETTIEHATIDHRNYAYGLRLGVPPAQPPAGDTYRFQYAVIEYEYPM